MVRVEKPELYDLASDPGEKSDVSAQYPREMEKLLALPKLTAQCREPPSDEKRGRKTGRRDRQRRNRPSRTRGCPVYYGYGRIAD